MSRYHLDTDFLIHAVSQRGPEWHRLQEIAGSDAVLEISAVAWYEFCRGPRSPEQLAVARALFGEEGVIAFDEGLAETAGDEFRKLGGPRQRAADIAIGVTARSKGATILTRNEGDFANIPGLSVEATQAPR